MNGGGLSDAQIAALSPVERRQLVHRLQPAPDRDLRQLGLLERMSASPGMGRATLEAAMRIDVRPILPTISTPTLVVHRRPT